MKPSEKRGYLDREFRLFHLREPMTGPVPYHYHDFSKVLILLQGNPDYIVEGRNYRLEPLDIVLVGRQTLHRPALPSGAGYERIILYVSPDFLETFRSGECDLNLCFKTARQRRSDVLRLGTQAMAPLLESLRRLEDAAAEGGYAAGLYCRLLFLEFMVQLNRAAAGSPEEYVPTSPCSEKISELMRCISEHPQEAFTIDGLAARFYMSKYHMMRLFRQETGYTIADYIAEKRLQAALESLRQGTSVTEAGNRGGFLNYAAFLRACRKKYGETPRALQRKLTSGLPLTPPGGTSPAPPEAF